MATFFPARKSEIQNLRAGLRVLEKHFVKIAEPKQKNRVARQIVFEAAILRHHRRELIFGSGHGKNFRRNCI
jgi:hypothetical protein